MIVPCTLYFLSHSNVSCFLVTNRENQAWCSQLMSLVFQDYPTHCPYLQKRELNCPKSQQVQADVDFKRRPSCSICIDAVSSWLPFWWFLRLDKPALSLSELRNWIHLFIYEYVTNISGVPSLYQSYGH
jgi:hypothetical protein